VRSRQRKCRKCGKSAIPGGLPRCQTGVEKKREIEINAFCFKERTGGKRGQKKGRSWQLTEMYI